MGDAVRARALLEGRDFVLPDDVKALAGPVLHHRLVLSVDARIRDRQVEDVLAEVMEQVHVPVEFQEERWQLNEMPRPTPEQLQLKNTWLGVKEGEKQGR